MTNAERNQFQKKVLEYYRQNGRHDLPWRIPEPGGGFDPYKIFVSELMLQQTQVSRVIPKFKSFLNVFPTAQALANAGLSEVLIQWSGLGYNRRAKFLWQSAQKVTNDLNGIFPNTLAKLTDLPGVGKNTAGAIMAYAFNQPVAFIETNIRTVYIYHFLSNSQEVDDKHILQILELTIDNTSPRQWYWALMDYGSYLKSSGKSLNKLSRYYHKQSAFYGSTRQIRGKVIRALTNGALPLNELIKLIPDDRLDQVLANLVAESMITKIDKINCVYALA